MVLLLQPPRLVMLIEFSPNIVLGVVGVSVVAEVAFLVMPRTVSA